MLLGVTFRAKLLATLRAIAPDLRYLVRSNLSLLALLSQRNGMPDPEPHRAAVAALLRRLERTENES